MLQLWGDGEWHSKDWILPFALLLLNCCTNFASIRFDLCLPLSPAFTLSPLAAAVREKAQSNKISNACVYFRRLSIDLWIRYVCVCVCMYCMHKFSAHFSCTHTHTHTHNLGRHRILVTFLCVSDNLIKCCKILTIS